MRRTGFLFYCGFRMANCGLINSQFRAVCDIPIEGICIVMQNHSREKIKKRINRVAGQISGIQRMIDEERYCVDILNQIAAVRSALDALGFELLTSHLRTCVVGEGSKHPKAKPMQPGELIDELDRVLSRFLK
jgi:CsoR family transcriptional regulator, copper-sensing transcriptional repressor